MAPCNGTQQWHHVHSPKVSTPQKLVVTLPPNHSTLQWHPTMAPSNGTTSTAPCNGTLVPRPIRQSGSSPSPPIGSKNPYSYRYLGKNKSMQQRPPSHWLISKTCASWGNQCCPAAQHRQRPNARLTWNEKGEKGSAPTSPQVQGILQTHESPLSLLVAWLSIKPPTFTTAIMRTFFIWPAC